MSHGDIETLAERLKNLEDQLRRSQRQRRNLIALALAGGVLTWAAAALSAPGAPLACGHNSILYCFGAGQPALASEINSNFETVAAGVDAASASAATKLPLAGGAMTGTITTTASTAIQGGNAQGNLHIDAESSGADGQMYLNWFEGKGVVIGRGNSTTSIANFNSSTGKATIGGHRVPSEVVVKRCSTTSGCTADCPTGTVVKLAWGFHGMSAQANSGAAWACGQAYQWMGTCIGMASCTISTGCDAGMGGSSLWLECW